MESLHALFFVFKKTTTHRKWLSLRNTQKTAHVSAISEQVRQLNVSKRTVIPLWVSDCMFENSCKKFTQKRKSSLKIVTFILFWFCAEAWVLGGSPQKPVSIAVGWNKPDLSERWQPPQTKSQNLRLETKFFLALRETYWESLWDHTNQPPPKHKQKTNTQEQAKIRITQKGTGSKKKWDNHQVYERPAPPYLRKIGCSQLGEDRRRGQLPIELNSCFPPSKSGKN